MLWKKLFDYQKPAAEFVLRHPGSCLFFDQGTGKTFVTLGVIERECENPDYQALLVVLKTNKITTWDRALRKHLPQVNVHCSDDLDAFKKLPFPRVMLVHYEQLTKRLTGRVKRLRWSFIAYDESQRLKARNSLSSRMAAQLRGSAERRVVLSGTPIDKSPVDLWAQLRFVDDTLFGSKWKEFFNRYLRKAGFMGYKHKFRAGKQELFLKRASKVCLRVDRSVLNLKGSRMHEVRFDLFGKQRELYDTLENDLVAEIGETGMVTTPLKVTLMGKLSQVTGGFVKDDDGTVHPVGRAKQRKLKAILPQLKPPIVVFCRYIPEIHEVERILRGHYLAVKSIHGAVKDRENNRERTDILTRFQSGHIDALVCQIKTGGVGVDLFRSCNAVFYSTTFSYIDFEQAKSRLERYGQEKEVDFYYLMAQNTIDEDLLLALQNKHKVSSILFSRLQRQHKESAMTATEKAPKAEKTPKAAKAVAKPAKAEKAAPAKAAKSDAPEFKYGVHDLAKMAGLKEASVRVALRNKGIKKAGQSYGWNTKDELQAVHDKCFGHKESKGKDTKGAKKAA